MLALNEANKKADEQEKANQDILCMSEQQEQSKAILDGLRAKLSNQVADKQKEIDKLQEEKVAAERERDDALSHGEQLKADIGRLQTQHGMQQKEVQDQLTFLQESSNLSDKKSQELLQNIADMELKEKSLLEQIGSVQKKEAGASAKASSLESQLLEN